MAMMGFTGLVGMPLRGQFCPVGVSTPTDDSFLAALTSKTAIGVLAWDDEGSHTVDTSGSSSIGWRAGAISGANSGTTFKVGIAAVDLANGPAPRPVNSANAITFDVAAVYTGGGAFPTNAWNESVPTTGSKTIAHGDLIAIAVEMTSRGGSDVVPYRTVANVVIGFNGSPTMTHGSSGTWTANNEVPNFCVTASDGTRGYLRGSYVFSSLQSQTWNNTSTTKEYGNLINLPYAARAHGIVANLNPGTGDFDLVLYSDPLSTPVASRTVSFDANNTLHASSVYESIFSSPLDLAANTAYAAIIKPTTANNAAANYKTFGNSAHQAYVSGGANGYAINRNTGAFAAQNSSLDRFHVGLLIGPPSDYPRPSLHPISSGMSR